MGISRKAGLDSHYFTLQLITSNLKAMTVVFNSTRDIYGQTYWPTLNVGRETGVSSSRGPLAAKEHVPRARSQPGTDQ